MFGSTARCLFLLLQLSYARRVCLETDNKISIRSRAMARPKVKSCIRIYVVQTWISISDR